jgi:hypothetical protein
LALKANKYRIMVYMNTYPTELAPRLTFLTPAIDLGERGNAALQAVNQAGFVAAVGLTRPFLPHVRQAARDKQVREYSWDDEEHFRTVASARRWHSCGRGVVGLFAVEMDATNMSPKELAMLEAYRAMPQEAWAWASRNNGTVDVACRLSAGAEGKVLAPKDAKTPTPFPLRAHFGELVLGAAVKLFGSPPDKVRLTHWDSNAAKTRYFPAGPDNGFATVDRTPLIRPTLRPVGEIINGSPVRQSMKGKYPIRIVQDLRVTSRLEGHPLLEAA